MIVMLSLLIRYMDGALPKAKVILLNALLFYPVGFLMGFAKGSAIEKKYHERLNVK